MRDGSGGVYKTMDVHLWQSLEFCPPRSLEDGQEGAKAKVRSLVRQSQQTGVGGLKSQVHLDMGQGMNIETLLNAFTCRAP